MFRNVPSNLIHLEKVFRGRDADARADIEGAATVSLYVVVRALCIKLLSCSGRKNKLLAGKWGLDSP